MTTIALKAATTAVTLAALVSLGFAAKAGPDNVKLPENLGVLYGTVDRADTKLHRELYATPAAVEAARAGKPKDPTEWFMTPLPSGSVLTMVSFKAKLDDKGAPVKGADGRFVKGELAAYGVMEKRTGWGAEYPAELRNGEWEYQIFTAAKAPNTKANIKGCFECDKPKQGDDYLFTLGQLKAAK